MFVELKVFWKFFPHYSWKSSKRLNILRTNTVNNFFSLCPCYVVPYFAVCCTAVTRLTTVAWVRYIVCLHQSLLHSSVIFTTENCDFYLVCLGLKFIFSCTLCLDRKVGVLREISLVPRKYRQVVILLPYSKQDRRRRTPSSAFPTTSSYPVKI